MSDDLAKKAFEDLRCALPSHSYRVRDDYTVTGKVAIHRTDGVPKIVLVWKANGLDNELTTRTEYVATLSKWFKGFAQEQAKPQYSRTFSTTAEQLKASISHGKTEIAACIVAINKNR